MGSSGGGPKLNATGQARWIGESDHASGQPTPLIDPAAVSAYVEEKAPVVWHKLRIAVPASNLQASPNNLRGDEKVG